MLNKHVSRLLALATIFTATTFTNLASAQTLLSQGKTAVGSSQEGGFTPASAIDGNTGSRWASNYNDAEWIYVDLGTTTAINRVVLNWEAAYGKAYQIQVSNNASTWTTVYSTTTGDGAIDDLAVSGSGRYVRMNGVTRGTGYGYSLWEFQVYGSGATSSAASVASSAVSVASSASSTSVSGATLLSGNVPTVASTQQGGFAATGAVDGNTGTRWASNYNDVEWIYLDLGSSANISRVVLNWEAAYGKGYQIQVSDNASTWTNIFSTTNGDGGTDDLSVSGSGRYVRMNGITRGTGYGYSLWEFQVYGTRGAVTSSSSPASSSKASSSLISSSVASSSVASSSKPASSSAASSVVSSVKSSSSVSSASSVSSTSSIASSKSSAASSSAPAVCSTLPSVPNGLAASGVTATSLTLSWTASTPGANCAITGYRVFKNGTQAATPTATNTSLTGLTASTTYSLTVAAVNSFGVSEQSAVLLVATTTNSSTPDFGSNVVIFDTTMPTATIQSQINSIYSIQQNNQFGTPRTAIFFKPGTYDIDIPVGFFTHIMGLGSFPDQVKVASVRSEAVLPNNNATQNFWRGVENFSVTQNSTMRWGVSQAVPFRRMHVLNGIRLSADYGWASGGWMADSLIDGAVDCWSQQQWISRNSQWGSFAGQLWNQVFVGIPNNVPGGQWPNEANTVVNTTPIVREKPFVYLNGNSYEVFVPSLRTNTTGISWANNQQAGTSIPLDQFYLAHAGVDTAATINAALAQGKHLLLTPGVYDLTDTIQVNRADTIVLGIGFATLHPINGKTALSVADVDGVKIAHLMVDAGTTSSPVLIQVGQNGSNASHASNPTSLIDIFVRVGGGSEIGRAAVSVLVNSNDVIIDHTWLWRADHGVGANTTGWTINTAKNGLVVNGNNVTAYGLFVEHFQEYQVLWNGNNGRTYFYQSEIPYDPTSQSVFTSGPGVNGWASYKVADNVSNHEAWGLGVYSVFTYPNVLLSHAIEVPNTPNVKFHHMVTVNLTANGSIQNVINNTGGATPAGVATGTPRVTDYPAQ
jgi:hypothetical protein